MKNDTAPRTTWKWVRFHLQLPQPDFKVLYIRFLYMACVLYKQKDTEGGSVRVVFVSDSISNKQAAPEHAVSVSIP
jgi:hypothetical protein